VILSADEAWDLMANTGPQLVAAGFASKPLISKRIFLSRAPTSTPPICGRRQAARECQLVGDVRRGELSAADIARREQRASSVPGADRADQVDLLRPPTCAQRQDKQQLSGAEMLRLGPGLMTRRRGRSRSKVGMGRGTARRRRHRQDRSCARRAIVGELRATPKARGLGSRSVGLGGCLAPTWVWARRQ
jgi:hypothetical protein